MVEVLDLVGVFAFALFGAHKALQACFDLFGIVFCAAMTALGGGTIRELLLNSTPVYLYNMNYVWVVLLGVASAIITYSYFSKMERYVVVLDAIGIAVFAYIGAFRADVAQLGLFPMILFAVLTACGGGIISDLISGHRPEALYRDFYPLAAIALAIGYFFVRPDTHEPTALALIALAFVIRLISLHYKWRLWSPNKREVKSNKIRKQKLIPLRQTLS